jgi:hypothetical protein
MLTRPILLKEATLATLCATFREPWVVLCLQSEQLPFIPFSFEPRVYCRVRPVYCVGLFSTYSRVTDLLPLFHLQRPGFFCHTFIPVSLPLSLSRSGFF